MTRRAWYLGHAPADVGACAILVGDPDRVDRMAPLLQAPRFLPVQRGLRTVTGDYNGARVSIVAFGMGAPIATIVLHELAHLGLARFVRIGTAMVFPPAQAGDFVLAAAALGFDGTTRAYRSGEAQPGEARPGEEQPGEAQVLADPALVGALEAAARAQAATVRTGTFATFDAFYRDMIGIDAAGRRRAAAVRQRLREKGVLAADMETAALLAAAQALGVASATLCLGTVDGLTREKLAAEPLARREATLFRLALDAITAKEPSA